MAVAGRSKARKSCEASSQRRRGGVGQDFLTSTTSPASKMSQNVYYHPTPRRYSGSAIGALRLKGPMFCLKSIALTWKLFWVLVAAAALGMLQGIIP